MSRLLSVKLAQYKCRISINSQSSVEMLPLHFLVSSCEPHTHLFILPGGSEAAAGRNVIGLIPFSLIASAVWVLSLCSVTCLPACPSFQSCRKASHTHTFSLSLWPEACCPKIDRENDTSTLRTSSQEKSCMSDWNILSPRGLDRSMEDNKREWAIVRHFSLIILVHSGRWCIRKADSSRVRLEWSIILDRETSSSTETLSSSCYSFPPPFTHLHRHTDTHSHLPPQSAHREINC